LPENKVLKEVAQNQAREVKIKAKITTPSLLVAYRTVPVSHQDTYALDLLSHVLTEGPSSRLYKKLVYEKQWASAVIGSHSSLKEAGVFSLTAQLKPESDMNKVADFIYHELWKLRTLKISEKELNRAKIAVLKSTVSALTTMDGKARSLAVNEILTGNYENLYSDLNKYQQVTVENILLVAQKYLKPEQRNLAILEPEK
jgi:zinc protease